MSGLYQKHYKFLILKGFSLAPYSIAIDALRLANVYLDNEYYSWQTISVDSSAVQSSGGVTIQSQDLLTGSETCDILFVCGGINIEEQCTKPLVKALRELARRGINLGSLCTGSYVLAHSKLLDGYRCTIHWKNLSSAREKFPHLNLTSDIYEIDRDRFTCAGGITPIDMIYHIIEEHHGQDIAKAVIHSELVERVRDTSDSQNLSMRHKVGVNQPKITEAVSLMEANLEEPIKTSEIAALLNISIRHLERLFQEHLKCSPTKCYLEIRLNNARLLLLQTDLPIIQISILNGFRSASHFSKSFRNLFGHSPTKARKLSVNREES
ncbi:MAG: GlxA family transcriptional regulator [Kangiellaceae bacterium]